MKLQSFGLSDLGNRRKNNEDRFLRDDRRGLYIVCDGMGGAAAGEVASGNGAAMVYQSMVAQAPLLEAFAGGVQDAVVQVKVALETAIRQANLQVFKDGRKYVDQKGMGTTLTALAVGAHHAVVAHVGDSRCYHLHDGRLAQCTQDHTWVAQQVRLGKMTAQEASTSKHQNLIMRALGIHPDVEVDTTSVPVTPSDRFLLCSDGLHGYFKADEEIRATLSQAMPLQRMALTFIATARERGGKDNVTAVLVQL